MTYRAHVPDDWRKMQRVAAYEEARRDRAKRILNRRRWQLVWRITRRALFIVGFIVVVIAAICGLTLGGLASTRRRRY